VMLQVAKEADEDPAKFVPLSPQGIISQLKKKGIEAFRQSGIELGDEQRDNLKVAGAQMRKALEELEKEDGLLTRVRANCHPSKLCEYRSFEEAMNKGVAIPVERLGQRDRKKLTGKCFIYFHAKPRPATVEALMRRVDEDVLPRSKEQQLEDMLKGPSQLFFRFTKDARLAAELGNSDEGQALYAAVTSARDLLKDAEQQAKDFALRKSIRLANPAPAAADQEPLFTAPAAEPDDIRRPVPQLSAPIGQLKSSVNPNPASGSPSAHTTAGREAEVGSAPGSSPEQLKVFRHAAGQRGGASTAHASQEAELVSAPRRRYSSAPELAVIVDAARSMNRKWNGADVFLTWDEVRKLFAECREFSRDCTPDEVAHFVLVAMERAKTMSKPVAAPFRYLMKVVPKQLEEPALGNWRAQQAQLAREKAAAAADQPQRIDPERAAFDRQVDEELAAMDAKTRSAS
jgi:hypothetical protein